MPVTTWPGTRCRSSSSPSTRFTGRWRASPTTGGCASSRSSSRMRDDGARSIPALAQWGAARVGDAEAVVDGAPRLTFRDVAARARRATRAVMAAGIGPGDRVAIWAPNSWQWMVAALGALGAAAWLVPVNTRFKGDEAAYVLERVDAAALFTVRDFLDTDSVALLHDAAPRLVCL